MIIIADINEKATNPKVIASLKKLFPSLKLQQLKFGDLNVILDNGDLLAIERKEAHDFLGSIGDGRVFRQVEAMSNGAKWCAIIIQGVISFDENDMTEINGKVTNWRGASVRGALLAIQWSGCPIIFTASFPYDYAEIVADIIKFCSKPDVHHQSLGRKRIVTFPPISLPEEIVAGFPGIGLKRARSLINFAKDMDDKSKEPSLAKALCWVTYLPRLDYKSRPEGWGDKTVTNFRLALGLSDNEHLIIEEERSKNGTFKKSKRSSG